ncbi:50s ribosomal protein l36 [Annulohypoxylon bovei var. microspora]|nr:50s ribosomal protein l36 [Annulohypoxylon bovei var. microspora]
MAISSLVSSLRALSLRAAPATRQVLRTQPIRKISQAVLTPSTTTRPSATTIKATGAVQAITHQQTRGMKVHSSVKKRCEHCKVSYGRRFDAFLSERRLAAILYI